ncbi:MAG: alpha/beta hydrolase [Pirellulales bacterium]|nr:alpha/beta hydrolase [Pirellulales bacterium]
MTAQGDDWQHEFVSTGDVRLHVVLAGPPSGPPVILLHGFPEFWYSWRHQIDDLARAGYRVVAPDQRGYNLSDKPARVRDYTVETLATDVFNLADALGLQRPALVGHDWGAAVTWWAALRHPQRLSKIAILNVPHPIVMARALRKSWAQLRKSWYVFFFQLPWLPERGLTRAEGRAMARGIQKTGRAGAFTVDDLPRYREAWLQPGAATGMINWYRAAVRYPLPRLESMRVSIPTLIIWGAQDQFLGRDMAQASVELCDAGELRMIEEATHWVQHEESARINPWLIDYLRP